MRSSVLMGADFYEDETDKAENQATGRPPVGIGQNSRLNVVGRLHHIQNACQSAAVFLAMPLAAASGEAPSATS